MYHIHIYIYCTRGNEQERKRILCINENNYQLVLAFINKNEYHMLTLIKNAKQIIGDVLWKRCTTYQPCP